MIKIKTHWLFLLMTLSSFMFQAQSLSPAIQREVDSLKKELRLSKEDTSRANLLYRIGVRCSIDREGYWDSIIKVAQRYKMNLLEIQSYYAIAHFLGNMKFSIKAAEYCEKSISVAKRTQFKKEMYSPLSYLANHYTLQGNTTKALNYCYEFLRISEELKDSNQIANAYSKIGDVYFQIHNYKKALEAHLDYLSQCLKSNNTERKLMAILSVGSDYFEMRDTSTAILYYLKTLNYLKEPEAQRIAPYIYNTIAATYDLKRKYDSAFQYSKIAVELCRKQKYEVGISGSLATLANICLHMGKYKDAEKHATEALTLAKKVDFKLQIPVLAVILRKIYEAEGNYKEALRYYEIGEIAKDSLQSADNKKQALEKEFNYNLEKKESENKLLLQQTQIQNLKLQQNNYFLFGLGGLALIILIIAYLFIRQNRLKNAHQKMYMEQKLISSQMNPHFVFNSLNSIQHLIMAKENDKAEIYLSKFANLIRELLESNTKESLTLSEEVGILNGFLEMESRRFGKSFNYKVIVEEGIDKDKTNIPHMLVQPFIENAIWHGLLAKEGERNLSVVFTTNTDKTLLCVVQDNGIGREASNKKQSTFKRKSLALSFVKQRLELLSETLKIKCSVEIIDMMDENGVALGTKVILLIPILT